jgi:transcriptional regulator GlxA family with amidase domain
MRQARWVHDGRFWTSSGISAGIEMTLGLTSHLFSRDAALEVAHHAEYVWNENPLDGLFC